MRAIVGAPIVLGPALPAYRPQPIKRVSTDSRMIGEGDLFIAVRGERFDGHDFVAQAFEAGAVAAVVSDPAACGETAPTGPLLVVRDTVDALGKIAAWHRREHAHCTVVGITGTNGKTTTKELVAHLLGSGTNEVHKTRANDNNLIGVPQTLLGIRPEHRYCVVELGSNRLGEIPALASVVQPDLGVLTNSAASHLDGLKSEQGVMQEEASMLAEMSDDGLALLNADCESSEYGRAAARDGARILTFGLEKECDFRAEGLSLGADGVHFTLRWQHARNGRRLPEARRESFFVPLPGMYNVRNALAALAVAWHAGVAMREIKHRLRTVRPPSLRSEIRELAGGALTLIDDCYNANPASMQAALETLVHFRAQRHVAVLGEMAELSDLALTYHHKLGEKLAAHGIPLVVTVGAHAAVAGEVARQAGATVVCCDDAVEAAERLVALLEPGDTVLVKGSRSNQLEVIGEVLTAQQAALRKHMSAANRSKATQVRRA